MQRNRNQNSNQNQQARYGRSDGNRYEQNDFNQNQDRNQSNSQHFNADQNYAVYSPADRGYGENHFGTQPEGNRSENSNYGGSYLNWGSKESHSGRGPKDYRRSDERIHEDVSEALTHDHDVDASEIEVSVAEGVVTLSGTVPDRTMKRTAEDCIESVTGVKDVKNNLTVMAKLQSDRDSNDRNAKSKIQSQKLQ